MGLLLGIGCNGTMVTASSDRDDLRAEVERVANAFGVLRSESSTEEQKKQAKTLLNSKDIIPEACYTQEDIDRAWNGEWAPFAQNVVCVSKRMYKKTDERGRQPKISTGTGTLIDVGIPGLKGRVVVTCAHVVLPNSKDWHKKNNSIKELCLNENGGDQIISIGSQKLRHFQQFVDGSVPGVGRFMFNENTIDLGIKAECQQREILDRIQVTDIYVLNGNDEETSCYDIAICILAEPVQYKGVIVPGVELSKLNIFTETGRIDAMFPRHHICLERSPGEVLPMDKRPVVIGYGQTGLGWLVPDDLRSGFSLMQNQSFFGFWIKKAMILNGLDLYGQGGALQSVLGCNCVEHSRYEIEGILLSMSENIQLYEEYISHAARCVQLAKISRECRHRPLGEEDRRLIQEWGNRPLEEETLEVFGEGVNMPLKEEDLRRLEERVNRTFEHFRERAKEYLEEAESEKNLLMEMIDEGRGHLERFRATKSLYADPLAGKGFSGSLVVRKSDDGNYDAIGIYGGPLFTVEIKNFIENAIQYHQLPEESRRAFLARELPTVPVKME
ncbi:MAG: hypothetical protein LBF34_00125 [Puniceicoccales bacterium]|jgi:hypothetical protein|nr:hypothetical protein [Puniceicoccales bacterium]